MIHYSFFVLCIQVIYPFIQFFYWLISLLTFYLIACSTAFSNIELSDYFLSCYHFGFTPLMFQYLLDKLFTPLINYHNLEDDYYK